MPTPQDKDELQCFLGTLNYLSQYIPKLAEKLHLLCDLLKSHLSWVWDPDHQKYGDFYEPRKARFILTFCKRINRTSTAVGIWVTAFEEKRRTTFSATKFIYNNNNNNNNKQGFTPHGTNNECVSVQKRIQGSDSRKGFVRFVRFSCKVVIR